MYQQIYTELQNWRERPNRKSLFLSGNGSHTEIERLRKCILPAAENYFSHQICAVRETPGIT